MLGVADTVGAKRLVLGGISAGGATALHAAALAPERVDAIVLIAPPVAWEARPAHRERHEAVGQLLRHTPEQTARHLSLWSATVTPYGGLVRAAYPLAQPVTRRRLARMSPDHALAILDGAGLSDLPRPDDLRALRVPVLVLAWANDPGHPLTTARLLRATMPSCDLRVATEVGELRAWSHVLGEFVARVAEVES
jgi:pimeloyl-ACP methyl ester carboxylesterase